MSKKQQENWEKLKQLWFWFKNLFLTYHELTVSYNFTVSHFYKKQDKYLKFKTEEGEIVEIRGAEGLNYRIKEL